VVVEIDEMERAMPANTRERLLDVGLQRFYRDGFRNVGLDQILKDVGISKTAFYKHFESKDELMLEALRAKDLWLQNFFREQLRTIAGPEARGQLYAVFDVVQMIVNNANFHGCVFVNAAMEFPLPHDPVHEAAAASKRAIEQIVLELAERAGTGDPVMLSRELCLLIEGAYVTRQVSGTDDAVELARRMAHRLLDARLAAAPTSPLSRSKPPRKQSRSPS
jgi:AcrR family transcriptional regulator